MRVPTASAHIPFAVRHRAAVTCVLTLLIWSSGALRVVPRTASARLAETFAHASLIAYAVGAVAIWALAHRAAALRARVPITREIF